MLQTEVDQTYYVHIHKTENYMAIKSHKVLDEVPENMLGETDRQKKPYILCNPFKLIKCLVE